MQSRARAVVNDAAGDNVIEYDGVEYPCTPSTHKTERTYRDLGLSADFAFSVLVDASLFSTLPSDREEVTYTGSTYQYLSGYTYRIMSVELDAIGACVRLDLRKRY